MKQVLIFKTNVHTKQEKQSLQDTLDAYAQIQRWTIDQQDEDCVLRIESEGLVPNEIIATLCAFGFECSILA